MRASIAQEDEAPSGVLPLEQVIAAAEGLLATNQDSGRARG